MNLSKLKNLVYRQKAIGCVVTGKTYEPPRRYGIGLGTLAQDNWRITAEDEAGNTYKLSLARLDSFDPVELGKGDKATLKITRIFGIPVYKKLERR